MGDVRWMLAVCTQYNTTYDDAQLKAYSQYAAAAGYPAHAYP